jgi:hypothetical protein
MVAVSDFGSAAGVRRAVAFSAFCHVDATDAYFVHLKAVIGLTILFPCSYLPAPCSQDQNLCTYQLSTPDF